TGPPFFYRDNAFARIIVSTPTSNTFNAISYPGGTVTDTMASAAGVGMSAVQIGTPTTPAVMYIATSQASGNLVKYTSGAGFSLPGPSKGHYLTTQQPDNRLVAAHTNTNTSRVSF